jgi:hypothetical protein
MEELERTQHRVQTRTVDPPPVHAPVMPPPGTACT